MDLTTIPYHKEVYIKKINIKNKKILKRLYVLGLTPHSKVTKVLSAPFKDPTLIKIRNNYLALSNNILKDIICELV